MYIKVWNKSDGVNRLHLQYLGLSTKRDDDSTIGQFGSGIKYAPILALRKDIDFVIVGKDDDGEYQLKYDTVNDKGIEVVYYDYGTYKVPSSFTVDAGKLSWENEFQIYREVVSNAKDSVESSSDWGIELVENIEFVDGQFSVFIEATREIRDIVRKHDYYYCDKATVLHTYENDIAVLKNNYGNTAVYCKTVLVHEDEATSFFHYNVKSARLNEERKLSSYYSLQYDLGKAIISITNEEAIDEVLENVIGENPIDGSSLEFWSFPTTIYEYNKASKVWQERFVNKFGEKAVLLNALEYLMPGVERKVRELGYVSINCKSDNLYTILKSAKVKTLSEIAGQELNYELYYDYEKYPNFSQALKIVNSYESQFSSMKKKVALFTPESSEILGLTINVKKPMTERQILISIPHAKTGSVEALVATLIHEYDHYTTGMSDSHPDFRNLADTRIGALMVENYKPNVLSTEKGSRDIKINISDLPYVQGLNFKIQKSEILDGSIVSVGNKNFLVKSEQITGNLVGSLKPSEDNVSLSITNAFFNPLEDDSITIREIK
jgi:hypothetical protein